MVNIKLKTDIKLAQGFIYLLLCSFIWLRADDALAAVILQYHHVSDDTPASTSVSPALFKQHLDYLAEHEFTVWPLPKLVEHLQTDLPVPDKVVVITFDDAYDSIYYAAFPLLKARKWPFTVFVAPQPVEQKLRSFMTWEQLVSMKKAGATLVNHSYNHAHLVRRLDDESKAQWLARIEADLRQTQAMLEKHLGETPKLLAYPYGEFNQELEDLVRKMGYVAFGQQSGAVSSQHSLTSLPRFPMTNQFGAMDQFKDKVASLPFPAQAVTPVIQVIETEKTAPGSLQLRLFPQAVREQQLSCFFAGVGRLDTRVTRTEDAILVDIARLPKLPVGRSRLNCTAPSSLKEYSGRFHWFSYFWMRKQADGNWYEED